MTKAIRIHQTGGPEVMQWEEVPVASPGPREVKLKQTAVGLNFIDVYHRTGLYPLGDLPATPGMEGAGIVEAPPVRSRCGGGARRCASPGRPP